MKHTWEDDCHLIYLSIDKPPVPACAGPRLPYYAPSFRFPWRAVCVRAVLEPLLTAHERAFALSICFGTYPDGPLAARSGHCRHIRGLSLFVYGKHDLMGLGLLVQIHVVFTAGTPKRLGLAVFRRNEKHGVAL
jgi:hypothetical protein